MIIVFKNPPFCKEIQTFSQNSKKTSPIICIFQKKAVPLGDFYNRVIVPARKHTENTRLILDIMSTFVRTTHATHPLLITSKMVVVLLLIFLPTIALANPVYQSSSNSSSTPYNVGAQSMQYQPASYQMTNTSNYQVSTTLSPAQTVYAPFSDENPSNSLGSLGGATASNGKDGFLNPGDPNKDEDHTEFPLGDAWSLLIFAAIGAGVIYIKQRKAEARG